MFERSNQYYKNRKRRREIDVEVIDNIKDMFDYNDKEIASLLNISVSQLTNYRKCGRAPADRVIALKTALELAIEDEAREKRDRLNKIMFSFI